MPDTACVETMTSQFIKWGGWLFGSAGSVGALISFLNYRSQAQKSIVELYEKAEKKRGEYEESTDKLAQLFKRLLDEMKSQKITDAMETREKVCSEFTARSLPRLLSYLAFILFRNDFDSITKNSLMRDVVIDEIKRFEEWVSIINHKKFISENHQAPLEIATRAFSDFLATIDKLRDEALKKDIQESLYGLCEKSRKS